MAEQATIRDDLRKDGYSREEEYFHRLNRELIEGIRRRKFEATPSARREAAGRPVARQDSRGRFWRRIRERIASGDTHWAP
jgi:hypothetical protein